MILLINILQLNLFKIIIRQLNNYIAIYKILDCF